MREQWESCSRGEEGRKKVRGDAHGAVLLPSAMEQGGEMASVWSQGARPWLHLLGAMETAGGHGRHGWEEDPARSREEKGSLP